MRQVDVSAINFVIIDIILSVQEHIPYALQITLIYVQRDRVNTL